MPNYKINWKQNLNIKVPRSFYAMYSSFEYLLEHWKEEYAILSKWCEIVGLEPHQYTIDQPVESGKVIVIKFLALLKLDVMVSNKRRESIQCLFYPDPYKT